MRLSSLFERYPENSRGCLPRSVPGKKKRWKREIAWFHVKLIKKKCRR